MTYVEILSSVTTTVSFNHLPRLDYLLEEDEEIIDFRPLQEEQRQPRYSNPDATIRKPKCHEHGVKRHHPNIEMLCRIRDFVEDAIDLAQNDVEPSHPTITHVSRSKTNAISSSSPSSSIKTRVALLFKKAGLGLDLLKLPWK